MPLLSRTKRRLLFAIASLIAISAIAVLLFKSRNMQHDKLMNECIQRALKNNPDALTELQARKYCRCYIDYIRDTPHYFRKEKSKECMEEAVGG